MRLVIAHRAGDLPVVHAYLGALIEVLIKLVSLGAQGQVLPNVFLDLRYARVVFIKLGGDELAACPFRRTVDPREVRHRTAIQPDSSEDGGVAIIEQFGGVNNVRWD